MDNTVIRNTTMATERISTMTNEWATRTVPSNGVGADISDATSVENALNMAGLNFDIITQPIYDAPVNGSEIPHMRRITRSDNRKANFGIVSDNYHPIQNRVAFAMADSLVEKGAKFDRLGALGTDKGGDKGKFVWMQLMLPETVVNGEPFKPYVFISTGNSGKKGMTSNVGMFRAFCCNQMRLVLAHSTYNVNVSHKGDVEYKVQEANRIMAEANSYIDVFKKVAEELRKKAISNHDVDCIVDMLLPIKEGQEQTEKTVDYIIAERNRIKYIYVNAPDLQNEGYNGYRLLNAVSDYESHWTPRRNTATWKDNRLVTLNTSAKTMTNRVSELLLA